MITDDAIPPQPTVSRARWWIHLILIGGYFAISVPIAVLQGPHRSSMLATTRGLLSLSIVRLVLFLAVFCIGWFSSRASTEDLLLKWRPGWWVVPLGVVYSIGLRLAAGVLVAAVIVILIATHLVPGEALTRAFSERPPIEKVIDPSAMQSNPTYYWLTVTFVGFVVAGLLEELWRAGTLAGMRALWPSKFGDRNGGIAAVALIAVVFGLLHLPLGLIMAAMASVIGFLLGIIMIVHRSIWPAVFAHGMFDATTFALLPWLVHLHQVH